MHAIHHPFLAPEQQVDVMVLSVSEDFNTLLQQHLSSVKEFREPLLCAFEQKVYTLQAKKRFLDDTGITLQNISVIKMGKVQ